MAEKTLEHNTAIMAKAQEDEAADRKLGMWLGFSALMALVIGAIIALLLHEPVAAAAFLGVGALGAVGRFILGRHSESSEPKKDRN